MSPTEAFDLAENKWTLRFWGLLIQDKGFWLQA